MPMPLSAYGYDDHVSSTLVLTVTSVSSGENLSALASKIYDDPFDVVLICKGERVLLFRKPYPG